MSDGLNQVRAMRIAEIMKDFRDVMNYISSTRFNPTPEEYNEEGYVILRQCLAAAQALLAQPFQAQGASVGNSEQDKATLRRIISDAAVRRFQAYKIYMRATTCLRWVNMRAAILRGGPPNAQNSAQLRQIQETLRRELASLTDQRAYEMIRRSNDEDKWVAEDPSLAELQRLAAASNSG